MKEGAPSSHVWQKLSGINSWKPLQLHNETMNRRTTVDKMETTLAYNSKDFHAPS